MTSEDYDDLAAFHAEFKKLVRKYVPDYEAANAADMLLRMQERISVYSPYIWSSS